MEEIVLQADVRDDAEVGRGSALRQKGVIPCVVYGEGKDSLPLKIERSRLIKFMHAHHGGENMIIKLKLSGEKLKKAQDRSVIIKEIQFHPVSGEVIHVDFNEVSLTKRLIVKVPIHGQGEPVGVKQDGGTLEHVLWEVEIECLPTQIPEKIIVDVSRMKIGDTIHVKDLAVAKELIVKHDPESIVFTVVPPHKEEPAAAEEGAEASAEPEVIKKEKPAVDEEEEKK